MMIDNVGRCCRTDRQKRPVCRFSVVVHRAAGRLALTYLRAFYL
jgi:hypothetical protein